MSGIYIYQKYNSKSEEKEEEGTEEDQIILNESPKPESTPRDFDPNIDSEDEPLQLMRGIEVVRDSEGFLTGETIIKILDKRSTIRGIRKM